MSNPPVPIGAIYTVGIDRLQVFFDIDLEPGPITGSTITFRANNVARRATSPVATGDVVTASSTVIGADIGIDQVTYTPPPFDIRRAVSREPAVAFTDLPLSIFP